VINIAENVYVRLASEEKTAQLRCAGHSQIVSALRGRINIANVRKVGKASTAMSARQMMPAMR
jgi:hypothetical protein